MINAAFGNRVKFPNYQFPNYSILYIARPAKGNNAMLRAILMALERRR